VELRVVDESRFSGLSDNSGTWTGTSFIAARSQEAGTIHGTRKQHFSISVSRFFSKSRSKRHIGIGESRVQLPNSGNLLILRGHRYAVIFDMICGKKYILREIKQEICFHKWLSTWFNRFDLLG